MDHIKLHNLLKCVVIVDGKTRVSSSGPCGLIVNHSHVDTTLSCDKSCVILCGLRQIVMDRAKPLSYFLFLFWRGEGRGEEEEEEKTKHKSDKHINIEHEEIVRVDNSI